MQLLSASFRRATVLTAAGLWMLVVGGACNNERQVLATEDAGGSQQLLPEDASGAQTNFEAFGRCPTNECPSGWTTCPTNPFPCGANLRTDDANCGACGNHCPVLDGAFDFHASMKCVNGGCQLTCDEGYADCNGLVEDGCEVHNGSDRNNCGACGTVCESQYRCRSGVCECNVANSCGACGNVCPAPPESPYPTAWHVDYGCSNGECEKLGCVQPWRDCDQDYEDGNNPSSNGCEVNSDSDPANCGGCGQACAPGETCRRGKCVCTCGSICFDNTSNVENCGACGVKCLGPRDDGGRPACERGVCAYLCNPGWDDCDGTMWNGCETNTARDPQNCGACGVRCDGVEGQACVEGQCTTKECLVR